MDYNDLDGWFRRAFHLVQFKHRADKCAVDVASLFAYDAQGDRAHEEQLHRIYRVAGVAVVYFDLEVHDAYGLPARALLHVGQEWSQKRYLVATRPIPPTMSYPAWALIGVEKIQQAGLSEEDYDLIFIGHRGAGPFPSYEIGHPFLDGYVPAAGVFQALMDRYYAVRKARDEAGALQVEEEVLAAITFPDAIVAHPRRRYSAVRLGEVEIALLPDLDPEFDYFRAQVAWWLGGNTHAHRIADLVRARLPKERI